MRLKIILGFTLVGLVLFFAAMTSYLELSRLTTSVQQLIDKGAESVALSNGVLDILQERNTQIMSSAERERDSLIHIDRIMPEDLAQIDSLCIKAVKYFPRNKELASIAAVRADYMNTFDMMQPMTRTEFSEWYLNKYNEAYSNFNTSIKRFMLSTQNYVVQETNRFKANIYRTTMQSLVALCVSILILFVFFLLIDVYFIKPVSTMTKSLDKYLNNGISFNPEFEAANEPAQLKELLKRLVDKDKKKRDIFKD